MNLKSMKGNLMLLLTAAIWGCAFVAQSVSADYIGAFTFQAIRSFIGAIVLLPVIALLDAAKKKKGEYKPLDAAGKKKLVLAGVICGIILCAASNFQQIGIEYTTAGKAGFITALYIVIVPIFGFFTGKRPTLRIWLCVLIALVGLYLLSVKDGFSLGRGDLLIMCCALIFSVHIMVVDHYAPLVDGVKLSCIQFFVSGIISAVPMLIFEDVSLAALKAAAVPVLYAGAMSCGVAYTLQIVGQKYTKPAVASLIMSFESVFAVLGGMVILAEIPTPREAVGCVIMFCAIIITQLPEKKKAPREAA